jgi:opacity protein-like surface antigen
MRNRYPRSTCILVLLMFVLTAKTQSNQQKNGLTNHKWETSIGLGLSSLKGDVTPAFPRSYWSFSVRRNMSKWFAFQVQYSGGVLMGMSTTPANNYAKNPAWAAKYNAPVNIQLPVGTLAQINSANRQPVTPGSLDPVFYNYKSVFHLINLQLRFKYDINSRFNIYAQAGYGGLAYKTKIDAANKNGETYVALFRSVNNTYATSAGSFKKAEVISALRKGMDGIYETSAEQKTDYKKVNPVAQAGIGIAFRINSRLQIGMEYQISLTDQQLIDGQRWQEKSPGDAPLVQYNDRIGYGSLILSYGF